MLTLPLEPTDDLADPAFKDTASCSAWLAQLQLTNLQPAHSKLLGQINEFNRYPLRGQERLNTLELLRETVGYVQDNYAKKLITKPLPLNENEMATFVAILQLWQALVLGYQRCLQAYMAGDKQLSGMGALLCQRCLLYSGLAIFEHLRTGYQFDTKLWRQLHELYAFAENNALHLVEVADPLNVTQPRSSCQGIYVKTLLACYARPAELNQSQLQLLDGWLSQWSGTVRLERSYSSSKGDAQPLATDLSSTHGLRPVQHVRHSDTTRYIAMFPLSKLLRVKTILLQQGQTPQQLELGDNCIGVDCIEFLTFLHQSWCEERFMRFAERHPVTHRTQLCHKLENIYAHLSGRPFNQAGKTPSGNEIALETWQLENESIRGARLTREDKSGGRLSYNQLVALRAMDATTAVLGATAWIIGVTTSVNVSRAGHLSIGVRYLPGAAEAVRIRISAADNAEAGNYFPAVLLHAVPGLKTPPSLIIPRSCFLAEHPAKITHADGTTRQVKMGFSVEHGVDYERISFTEIDGTAKDS